MLNIRQVLKASQDLKANLHATMIVYNRRNHKEVCVCMGSSSFQKWLTSILIRSEVQGALFMCVFDLRGFGYMRLGKIIKY